MPARRDFTDSTLWSVSGFELMRSQMGDSGFQRPNGRTMLSASLMAELAPVVSGKRPSPVLSVLAACVRHREDALLMTRHAGLIWPLTVFPNADLYHSPWPLEPSLSEVQADLVVLLIEPAGHSPPARPDLHRSAGYAPLSRLLWVMSLHAPQAELLPEISGPSLYRLSASYLPDPIQMSGAVGAAIRRMRNESASLADISKWPGMDRVRAMRMLNAIYLQGGLMVLRAFGPIGSASGRAATPWWRRKAP